MSPSTPSIEMPKYKCHKEVHALKIADIKELIKHQGEREVTIVPEDKRYAPFRVTGDFMRKHDPQAGGYYVVYEDGYISYSPAEAFEDGYTLIE